MFFFGFRVQECWILWFIRNFVMRVHDFYANDAGGCCAAAYRENRRERGSNAGGLGGCLELGKAGGTECCGVARGQISMIFSAMNQCEKL